MKTFFKWICITSILLIMGCVVLAMRQNSAATINVSQETKEIDKVPIPKDRLLLTRMELLAREKELVGKFGIDTKPGTELETAADLYTMKDSGVKDMLVDFSNFGLALKLPYNEGWGYPHYKLVPFEFKDNEVLYGTLNPCPAGCSQTGALIRETIVFLPGPLSAQLPKIKEDIKKRRNDELECKSVDINNSVKGTYCKMIDAVELPESYLFIEGSKYTYQFTGLHCALYNSDESIVRDNKEFCKAIADSIKVE